MTLQGGGRPPHLEVEPLFPMPITVRRGEPNKIKGLQVQSCSPLFFVTLNPFLRHLHPLWIESREVIPGDLGGKGQAHRPLLGFGREQVLV